MLNKDGRETGIWGTGEIAIESDYLALGYWNRPDLTAASFTHLKSDSAKRLYLTGDIGKRLPNHSIEFLGRKDSQVKIRGQKIEIGEIESKLNGLNEIKNAVAAVQQDSKMNNVLVSFLIPQNGARLNISGIRNELRNSLPEYMIPQIFRSSKICR